MAAKHRDPQREQFWREAISARKASGLTVCEFCRNRQLAETAFHHWQRVLRQRDAKSAQRPAAFVPVSIVAAATVEVRCPSGHVVTLSSADFGTLRQLFAALAPEPPC